MKLIILISLFALSIVLAGCQYQREEGRRPERGPDVENVDAFRERLSEIKVGDSINSVRAVLGTPTYDRPMMRMENTTIIGHRLVYVLVQADRESLNENDTYVSLFFDRNGVLATIVPHDLP